MFTLNQQYLADPLTTEAFDRTPELRAMRAHEVSLLRNDGVGGVNLDVLANRAMFGYFAQEVEKLNQREESRLISEAISRGPSVDSAALALQAAMRIRSQLIELHQTLPLPGLDRLVHAQGATS